MARIFKWLAILLSVPAAAQTTTVTATVADTSSQAWANASYQINFLPAPGTQPSQYIWQGQPFPASQQQFNGFLSSGGTLSVIIPDSMTLAPAGSRWTFTICPLASTPHCQVVSIPVTGATQDVTSALTAGLAPPMVAPTPINYAYNTSEIQATPGIGQIFFNSISAVTSQWTGASWVPLGTTVGNVTTPLLTAQRPLIDVNYPTYGTGCANAADRNGVLDSTCAIQNAISYAESVVISPGAPPSLYFPNGVYKVSSEIYIPCSIATFGDGPNSSIIEEINNTSGVSITNVQYGVNAWSCKGSIHDLGFYTPNGHNYIATQLELFSVTGMNWYNLKVSGGGGRGIQFTGGTERNVGWGIEIDSEAFPLIYWCNECRLFGLNIASPGRTPDLWSYMTNTINQQTTTTGLSPNLFYATSIAPTFVSANANGTVASFYIRSPNTGTTQPEWVGNYFQVAGTTGTVLDGTYLVTNAPATQVTTDPSGLCTVGSPCWLIQAASSASGTANVSSATWKPIIYPEAQSAVVLGGASFSLDGCSIKVLQYTSGITTHQAFNGRIQNCYFESSPPLNTPVLNASITEGGLPMHGTLLANIGTGTLTTPASFQLFHFSIGFVNQIADIAQSGTSLWIGPPDFNENSSSPSAFVPGVNQNQYEVVGAVFVASDGNMHLTARCQSGSTVSCSGGVGIAWPINSIIDEHLDVYGTNLGPLNIVDNHIETTHRGNASYWFIPCNDQTTMMCSDIIGTTVPDNFSTTTYNFNHFGGNPGQLFIKGNQMGAGLPEITGEGWIKCRSPYCVITDMDQNAIPSTGMGNTQMVASYGMDQIENVTESDSTVPPSTITSPAAGGYWHAGGNAGIRLVSAIGDPVTGPSSNLSGWYQGWECYATCSFADAPSNGNTHAQLRFQFAGQTTVGPGFSGIDLGYWNGSSWVNGFSIYNSATVGQFNETLAGNFTSSGTLMAGTGFPNTPTPFQISGGHTQSTCIEALNNTSGAINISLCTNGSAHNPGWGVLHNNTSGDDSVMWNDSGIMLGRNSGYGFSQFIGNGGSPDTVMWRNGAGVFTFGNGTPQDFSGTVQATHFTSGSTAGVSCSGTPTASFASVNGIVTHC